MRVSTHNVNGDKMISPKEALTRQIQAALPRAIFNMIGETVPVKYDALDGRFCVILTPDQASSLCWPEDGTEANKPIPMAV